MKKKKKQINFPVRTRKSGSISTESPLSVLRKRAEEKLRGQSYRLEEISRQDIKTLTHDLGTYQIELEIQNRVLNARGFI